MAKKSSPRRGKNRRVRKHKRRTTELPVRIGDTPAGPRGEILFDTTDVSLSGAFLRSTVLFELAEELSLEFAVPNREPIRARARVVRVSSAPPGMGITFVTLSDHDRDTLRSFLRKGD